MKLDELTEILTKLAGSPGISGDEEAVIRLAASYFLKYCDEAYCDSFGNLVAVKKGEQTEGQQLKIALVAHIDEIGALVNGIEEGGFLRFAPIGGLDARLLPGQLVTIHGRKPLSALIGATAPHLLQEEDRAKTVPVEKLFIDTGLVEKKVRELIRIGDTISFDCTPQVTNNGKYITGKALDNRAGLAALLYCADELQELRHRADIIFIASLQEEVGLRGAITAAYNLKPDLAVAVDVTHGDIPGVDDSKTFKLGDGPALAVGPNFHPFLAKALQAQAKECNIAYQVEPIPGHSGTDAWAFQISREGIPTALLSIPLRYMHSPVEMLALEDLKNSGRLLAAFTARLNADTLKEMIEC